MAQINTLVVDDSKNSRTIIVEVLKKYCPNIAVIGEAENIDEAYNAINLLKPDLLFLDVEMPNGNAFDLLRRTKANFEVIFTTAYKEYAIDAIKNGALDYLLKPISIDDIIAVIEKAEKKFNQVAQNQAKSRTILLSDIDGLEMLNLNELVYCNSQKSYTDFYLVKGEKKTFTKAFKDIEENLPSTQFFRIHHSYIINRKFIKRFNVKDGGFVLTTTDQNIPVSKRKKSEFIAWLENG